MYICTIYKILPYLIINCLREKTVLFILCLPECFAHCKYPINIYWINKSIYKRA